MEYLMYYRTFFFLLFIVTTLLFFLSSYKPNLTLELCGSMCQEEELSRNYIQLTSMVASTISLILFIITNYYTEKKILQEREKLATDRLNIEQIHAELEALRA